MSGSSKKLLHAAAGTLAASGDPLYVDDVFSTFLYNGAGAVKTITNGIDLDGEGGVVWIKDRSGTEKNVLAYDENKFLSSNTTDAVTTNVNYVQSFNSDGFQVGAASPVTASGSAFASWTFRKAEKFFDVVTYTGNATARTIAHNLGSTPGMIIIKRTNGAKHWAVYHTSMGANYWDILNVGQEKQVNTNLWNNTAPTDSVFSVGTDGHNNGNNDTYVAFLFASDAGGYGDDGDEHIIKCGTFNTDGSGNATVSLGFEPQWVLNKVTSASDNWTIADNMRGFSVTNEQRLYANLANAEAAATTFRPTSTGYTVNGGETSKTYIYIAIRRPMKTPEAATEVFAIDTIGGTNEGAVPSYHSGFPVDMFIQAQNAGDNHMLLTRLMTNTRLFPNLQNAESAESDADFDYQDGAFSNTSEDTDRLGYMFRRAPGFFDVVCYAGAGSSAANFNHGLGVRPELQIAKKRNGTGNWYVNVYALAAAGRGLLNAGNQFASEGYEWSGSSATTFSVYGSGLSNINTSGATYVNFLFATLAGVSKVGLYTGTGADLNVACGFASGARFILIKRADSTGDWFVYDSVRGIVAGNDPYMLLNETAAKVTNTDFIDPLNAGFTVTSSASSTINVDGGTYIFLAIA